MRLSPYAGMGSTLRYDGTGLPYKNGHMTREPVDGDLIELFRSRDGTRKDVTLKDGRIFAVFNIAWGYDFDDPYAHISTNVSPYVEGQSFLLFHSRNRRRHRPRGWRRPIRALLETMPECARTLPVPSRHGDVRS
jgi:hypothetical protein